MNGSNAAIWFSGCRTNLPEGTLGHVLMHEILVVKFDRDGLLEEIVFDSRVDQGMDDAAPGARERRKPQLTPEPTR